MYSGNVLGGDQMYLMLAVVREIKACLSSTSRDLGKIRGPMFSSNTANETYNCHVRHVTKTVYRTLHR